MDLLDLSYDDESALRKKKKKGGLSEHELLQMVSSPIKKRPLPGRLGGRPEGEYLDDELLRRKTRNNRGEEGGCCSCCC